ncbi:hypothetical protein NJ76_28155 [Rhodococcus sp. IITR03]|nr:hypothetical protein NJ76_28155 [Rhodococcus sp. IITR03]
MFADVGVEVETATVASSIEQRHDLDSGRTDVGITATDNLLTWNSTGSTIEVIAQLESTTDLALTLRPELPPFDEMNTIRLAVDAPTNGFAIVAYSMMARLGCPPDRYEVVEIGGVRERFAALVAGRADVTLLAPPLDEAGVEQGMTVAMRSESWTLCIPVSELSAPEPRFGTSSTRSRSI